MLVINQLYICFATGGKKQFSLACHKARSWQKKRQPTEKKSASTGLVHHLYVYFQKRGYGCG